MSNSKLTIGITGIALNNGNLGCQALGYSSLAMLERVARAIDTQFNYVILESGYDREKSGAAIATMSRKVNVDPEHIVALKAAGWYRLRGIVRHPHLVVDHHQMVNALKRVDALFDLTVGDSFTDMYDAGRRLRTSAWARDAAFKIGVPVILGPQTIGPFDTDAGRQIGRRTLLDSKLVIARDELSAGCAKDIADIDVPVTTDLAFGLPYHRDDKEHDETVRVGFNPSGLLVRDDFEGGFDTSGFTTDYDAWISQLCDWLEGTGWEVHLISHVIGADYPVCERIKGAHPSFVLHEDFNNPVDAKSLISTMDVFVGSRMHATIAALSSGVPVVPVSYSRKFEGLFGTLGYDVSIDLRAMTTDEAVSETERLVEHYQDLKPNVEQARGRAEARLEQTRDILAGCFSTLL